MIAVETESSLQNSGKARAEDVAEELFEIRM